MLCPNCGNKMNDDAKFCSSCGWLNNIYKEKNKIPFAQIIGVIAVLVIVILLKGALSNGNKNEKNKYCGEYIIHDDGQEGKIVLNKNNNWSIEIDSEKNVAEGKYTVKKDEIICKIEKRDGAKISKDDGEYGSYMIIDITKFPNDILITSVVRYSSGFEEKSDPVVATFIPEQGLVINGSTVNVNNENIYSQSTDIKSDSENIETVNKSNNSSNNSSNNDKKELTAEQARDATIVSWYKSDTMVDDMKGIEFGAYPQKTTNNNSKQPIEWLVLARDESNKKVLLISKYILDCKCYNDDGKATSWENSSLRYWLNNVFINDAFSSDEIDRIEPTLLSNAGNSAYKVFGGNDTSDKIFELSIDEIEMFFSKGTMNVATRGTEYAKNVENDGRKLWIYSYEEDTADDKDLYEWADGNSSFWLRSPGTSLDTAACVARGGEIVKYGYGVHSQVYGIRPAMWVSY